MRNPKSDQNSFSTNTRVTVDLSEVGNRISGQGSRKSFRTRKGNSDVPVSGGDFVGFDEPLNVFPVKRDLGGLPEHFTFSNQLAVDWARRENTYSEKARIDNGAIYPNFSTPVVSVGSTGKAKLRGDLQQLVEVTFSEPASVGEGTAERGTAPPRGQARLMLHIGGEIVKPGVEAGVDIRAQAYELRVTGTRSVKGGFLGGLHSTGHVTDGKRVGNLASILRMVDLAKYGLTKDQKPICPVSLVDKHHLVRDKDLFGPWAIQPEVATYPKPKGARQEGGIYWDQEGAPGPSTGQLKVWFTVDEKDLEEGPTDGGGGGREETIEGGGDYVYPEGTELPGPNQGRPATRKPPRNSRGEKKKVSTPGRGGFTPTPQASDMTPPPGGGGGPPAGGGGGGVPPGGSGEPPEVSDPAKEELENEKEEAGETDVKGHGSGPLGNCDVGLSSNNDPDQGIAEQGKDEDDPYSDPDGLPDAPEQSFVFSDDGAEDPPSKPGAIDPSKGAECCLHDNWGDVSPKDMGPPDPPTPPPGGSPGEPPKEDPCRWDEKIRKLEEKKEALKAEKERLAAAKEAAYWKALDEVASQVNTNPTVDRGQFSHFEPFGPAEGGQSGWDSLQGRINHLNNQSNQSSREGYQAQYEGQLRALESARRAHFEANAALREAILRDAPGFYQEGDYSQPLRDARKKLEGELRAYDAQIESKKQDITRAKSDKFARAAAREADRLQKLSDRIEKAASRSLKGFDRALENAQDKIDALQKKIDRLHERCREEAEAGK